MKLTLSPGKKTELPIFCFCYLTLSLLVETSHLLITFAISLDPEEARQNVGPHLDTNCLTLMVFMKEFLKKLLLKKNSTDNKNM